MIILTRLGGHALAVNPDLIERAESTPDTVLTMVDGHKMVIAESLAEMVELIRTWRASVAAQAYSLSREPQFTNYADLPYGGHPSSLRSSVPSGLPSQGPRGFDDADDDQLTAHTAIQASLARVLRLPQRGE